MDTVYAGRGYPLGHTDPSPAFVLHRKGYTALHYAAQRGHWHLPAVNALIRVDPRAGAPLNIQKWDNGIYHSGWCAFCAAGRRGAESAAGRRGPVPPSGAAVARRERPLHFATWAAYNGEVDAMAALLAAGADAPIKSGWGYAVPRRIGRP